MLSSGYFSGRETGSLSHLRERLIGALLLRYIAYAGAVLLLAFCGPVTAEESLHSSVGGLEVYYGILPAEMVLGHEHEHSGSKAGRNAHHLIVALFSTRTGNRVTDAEVQARVEPLGLAGETRKLEPMTINRTVTFGNYFEMPGPGPYRISIRIRPPGGENWIETTFEYHHVVGD